MSFLNEPTSAVFTLNERGNIAFKSCVVHPRDQIESPGGHNDWLLSLWLDRINNLDMGTAVRYLKEDDADMQVLGAAYIQHECYNNSDSKNQVIREFLFVWFSNGTLFPM